MWLTLLRFLGGLLFVVQRYISEAPKTIDATETFDFKFSEVAHVWVCPGSMTFTERSRWEELMHIDHVDLVNERLHPSSAETGRLPFFISLSTRDKCFHALAFL